MPKNLSQILKNLDSVLSADKQEKNLEKSFNMTNRDPLNESPCMSYGTSETDSVCSNFETFSIDSSEETDKNQNTKANFIFSGQLLITTIASVPIINKLKIFLSRSIESDSYSFGVTAAILSIPFSLSILDSYHSIISRTKKKDLKKNSAANTGLCLLGSIYLPTCYAFTTYLTTNELPGLNNFYLALFIVSLLSFLLQSQINHSFIFLTKLTDQQEPPLNCIQRNWLNVGKWLHLNTSYFNILYCTCIITTSTAVSITTIDSFNDWPDNLYIGILIGLVITACLAQLEMNFSIIQSQQSKPENNCKYLQAIRCFLFDRPELALLWRFASRLSLPLTILSTLTTILLVTIPILDQYLSKPSNDNYIADASTFSVGIVFAFFSLYSSIHLCNKEVGIVISYSSWESILLACSSISLLTILQDNNLIESISSIDKTIVFIGSYLLSSIIITSRDYKINSAKVKSSLWNKPPSNREYSASDSVIYSRSAPRIIDFEKEIYTAPS